jgi:hypothetical protein
MKLKGIPIKGFRLDKTGKPVRDQRRLDVSTRLKRQNSKRVRVSKRKPTPWMRG